MFLHFFLVMSRHVNFFCLISLTTFRRFFEKKQASLERISSMQVSKVYVTVHVTNWLPTHIVRKWKWMSKNWASYNSTSQGFKELSQCQNTRNKKNFYPIIGKKNPRSPGKWNPNWLSFCLSFSFSNNVNWKETKFSNAQRTSFSTNNFLWNLIKTLMSKTDVQAFVLLAHYCEREH